MSIWIFFKLIGALALLMFGMKTMSDSLQKMAGPQLRHVLGTMTTNRLTGILSGHTLHHAQICCNRTDVLAEGYGVTASLARSIITVATTAGADLFIKSALTTDGAYLFMELLR